MTYKIKLEIFEGPLDLLLHLVKQNHLEITNIPIALITEQYLQYLSMMQALDLEIAGEFLVMAATLMQIKSRMPLPPETLPALEAEEPDPAQELIARLLEYQKFKQAAEFLGAKEKTRLVQFSRPGRPEDEEQQVEELAEASLFDLLNAFSQFMSEIPAEMVHEIIRDEHTVESQIALLRDLLRRESGVKFAELFTHAKSKMEIIATFLALLELIRLREAGVRQTQLFGEIVIVSNTETNGSGEVMP